MSEPERDELSDPRHAIRNILDGLADVPEHAGVRAALIGELELLDDHVCRVCGWSVDEVPETHPLVLIVQCRRGTNMAEARERAELESLGVGRTARVVHTGRTDPHGNPTFKIEVFRHQEER